jgi:xanthine dehydrogenase small subunit
MDNIRKYIEFVMDGALKRLYFDTGKGITPTTTLLQYLRADVNHRGTKEGCGEGDCGACTIVLGHDVKGKIEYNACNSCLILLPQIHGKQIITVENLQEGQQLHPVQKAMVEMDGSQCGFCTPGFVMSMFALYKSNKSVSDNDILEAFSGNLCRCTGYEAILKAARQALKQIENDAFNKEEEHILHLLSKIKKNTGYFETQGQHYYQPSTISDAMSWFSENQNYELISGSTDVALRVTKKKEVIPALLDLSQIAELKTSKESLDTFYIGSQVPLQRIKLMLGQYSPAVSKILSVFGSKQIRNLATLGGNIASASPIGDTLPLLMAIDAKVVLKSVDGERIVSIDKFITGYRQTVMLAHEIITQIIIPKPSNSIIIDMEKVSKRLDLDISSVSVALRLELSDLKKVKSIKIIYGGLSAYTQRALHVESQLQNLIWSLENVKMASAELE